MPCLSCKINGKLLNVLCRTCGELQSKDIHANETCSHTDSERELYGFFADVELIHAIHLGYKLTKVYQTIVYNTTANNCAAFQGRTFIKQCMYYKTLYSDVHDYNDEVLRGLKQSLGIDYNITDADHIQLRFDA
jgi:hypothetical protein